MLKKAAMINWPLMLSGVLGWLVVLVLHGLDGERLNISLTYFAFGLFLVAYLGINLINVGARKFKIPGLLIAVQFFAVLIIVTTNSAYILYILLVILASQLPFVFSNRQAYGLLILANFTMAAIYLYYWQNPVAESMIQFIIYFSFEFFAFTISLRATQESTAREKLELMNAELVSTRALLKDSVLKSERLKISRDLHDICGHQLTALILNLEYAAQTAANEQKSSLFESRDMAKSLLQNIRTVVRDIRMDAELDLFAALQQLAGQLKGVNLSLNYPEDLRILSHKQAEAILRICQEAITNAVRHGQGKSVAIDFKLQDHVLYITIQNPTRHAAAAEKPNRGVGLSSIAERIEEFNGSFTINRQKPNTFELNISMPILENNHD